MTTEHGDLEERQRKGVRITVAILLALIVALFISAFFVVGK
jgi:hypothetical protein